MILYIKSPKESTPEKKELLELINSVTLQDTRSTQMSDDFYTLEKINLRRKLRKQLYLQYYQKK